MVIKDKSIYDACSVYVSIETAGNEAAIVRWWQGDNVMNSNDFVVD